MALIVLVSCSSERNTWTSKAFHNTTAHYNGYFYANEEIKKIEAAIRENHVDDFNRVLWLFPSFDSSVVKTFEKELQESIKMASIAIQRHPNSKWVDDAYILVGKSRMYSMDWGNAIQTFKYANKISKDKDTKPVAIINLIRTYTEHKEFANAQAAIDHLAKFKLNRENKKKYNLEKAYFYQVTEDYDKMVRNLTEISSSLKKSDRRGRIYFIIGQVYQKLGFESEAYNYYRKCLSTNPEYEVDFYARLYMAQVKDISRSRDINVARKSFEKLLRDLKNKEFKDKIYYEMGIFELKQKNLKEAIQHFKSAVRQGTNTRIDGEAFLKLGEIYYDTLRDYELSQAYYDSAITALPQDFENYDQIKARQQILNEFVQHLKTIQWQDSLLTLSKYDTAAIRKMVDSVVTKRIEGEALKNAKSKRKSNRIQIDATDNSSLFSPDGGVVQDPGGGQEGAWYFSNPSTLAAGQGEFQRVWGSITLQDNWRRSSRQSSGSDSQASEQATPSTGSGANEAAAVAANPVEAEYVSLSGQIPRTDEQKEEALKKIEDAYFKLGEIYHFKLLEDENALKAYQDLLHRFPQTTHEPEVLYTMYLILKDKDGAAADQYASVLKAKYPTSTYARILINPSYLQESSQAAEKQKQLYKIAYAEFESQRFSEADSVLQLAYALGETSFTPSLDLMRVLLIGEREHIAKYQYELDQFIKKYPDTPSGKYAETLLAKSREFQEIQEKRKGIQYIRSLEEPHYFVVIYPRGKKLDEDIAEELEKFNQQYFLEYKFTISNLVYSSEFALTFVSLIENVTTAIEFYRTFNEKLPGMTRLRNHKFDNFVITKDNFDIFYRTKGLDEYLRFFEKNYPKENQ